MRALATKKLIDIGPVSLREWTTLATFACILFLWVCGTNFGISSALAAMIGVTVLLFVNVFDWEDCLKEKSAWDTLFWLGVLIGMSSSLKTKGFFDGYSDDLIAMTAHLDWQVALCIIAVIYYYCHYFFASNTTHIMAMFSAFLYASLQTGAPPLIAFFTLALASNLYGCLTHYSSGPAPVYFGASYVSLRTWWKVGFILSTIHLIVLLTVGLAWWKYLGI